MDRDILLLSATLCILSLGVVVLGLDLLSGLRRKAEIATATQDDLRVFLHLAPPMLMQPSPSGETQALPPAYEKPPLPEEFVFRRHASRDFTAMELNPKSFRQPAQAQTNFSAIRSEIRAVLDAAAPATPRTDCPEAQLIWTETDRLAVLSLAGAEPASGLALLRLHGIGTLIVASGHPFRRTVEDIEILKLPDGAAGTAPLAARLRAKLAQGQRIAFHTETGLGGAAAVLAARFSSRQASQRNIQPS